MVRIYQNFMTKNDCYKAGGKIAPEGIMLHEPRGHSYRGWFMVGYNVRKNQGYFDSVYKHTDVYYRVRKSWSDFKSQKGAFENLQYAISEAKKNLGYFVFDESGNKVNYDDNSDLLKRIVELESKLEAIRNIVK